MRVNPMAALLLAGDGLGCGSMPRLAKSNGGFQFLVDDRPFLILEFKPGIPADIPVNWNATWPLAKRIHAKHGADSDSMADRRAAGRAL